jgi:HJR/Mrr/RecB family endonuclease
MTLEPELFVWRDTVTRDRQFSNGSELCGTVGRLQFIMSGDRWPSPLQYLLGQDSIKNACLYCNQKYETKVASETIHKVRYSLHCPLCGFTWEYSDQSLYGSGCRDSHSAYEAGYAKDADEIEVIAGSLLRLSVNDSRLHLDELGSHLRRRYSDVYALDWHVFERLVADVYRNSGYYARLTKKTRDGGFDVVLLEKGGQEKTLVEVKRYAKTRKVGIDVVDRVLGVQLRSGVPRAKIVTSSTFSSGAVGAAAEAARTSSYQLELVDADGLLKALEVYNTNLPAPWMDRRLK